MASSMSAEGSKIRRVRGPSKGKSTQRIVKQTDKKIPVFVDKEFNALVGEGASKVAHVLGIHLRQKAPVEGISKWRDIDSITKESIVQGASDWFDIVGYGTNEKVTEIVDAKCQSLYRCWKSRAKNHYAKILAEGKDPYAHCFPTMEDAKWKYLIENVWTTEKFKKRSETNKENRDRMVYNHTMGSKSFASTLHEISAKARKDQVQPKFSEFYRISHRYKKKEGWINPRCEEDYVALQQLESESQMNGEELITPEEMSQQVFGSKNYLKGLGPSMKVSFKKKFNGKRNGIYSDELHSLNAEVETLRDLQQEYEDKFVSQDAMIKSLKDMIEAQNKKVEEVVKQNKRLANFIITGGSLSDETLSQDNNSN